MKTKTTKLSVLALLGLGLVTYGQDYSGKIGINYNKPNATLEIKGKSDNTDKTLEGLIIPNVSKNKAYLMTTNTEMLLKESTLIYVDNISDYTISPIDTKVADITEKGYYYWNGTKWVKSGNNGTTIWVNDSTNKVAKIKNLSDGITERLDGNNIFINDEGYIGVGTKSPERKLHLVGNGNALGEILLQSASNTNMSPGVLSRKLRGTIENPEAVMENDHLITLGGGAYDGVKYNYNRGGIFVNTSENWTDVAHGTNITFLTTLNGSDTRSEAMRIENNGNVGIGTTSPTEKLEVAGTVKATGFTGASGATIFPDYVFQKYYTGTSSLKADYSFKTLSQVENFVKTNGHLPGYQSAEAIKKQGYIDLMATQLTNVEKIEELYLHSIEQDKALKAKDAEIKELKERLSKIETLLSK
ncbi:hypothetical protein [Riemerella anatipestifer]|uniref:hypothetical protein n=1 Tax=Riemerella anatipestifer TaxID=34085 RepID=UPI0021A99128|nr:hypothetical protein [Riemerella anatipestifer]